MDNEIQRVGFLPDTTRYGMDGADTSPQQSPQPPPASGNADHRDEEPVHRQPGDHWVCSDKQEELILKLVEQHRLDKQEVETLSREMFGLPVKTLNRLQASGLIEELLERHGNAAKKNGGRANGAAAYRRHAARV